MNKNMRTNQELKKTIKREIKRIQDKLFLRKWKIKIEFGSLDGDTVARCYPDAVYLTATIIFDTNKLHYYDESFVKQTCRHEMLHVLFSSMFYLANIGADSDVRKMAEEHVVNTLERIEF